MRMDVTGLRMFCFGLVFISLRVGLEAGSSNEFEDLRKACDNHHYHEIMIKSDGLLHELKLKRREQMKPLLSRSIEGWDLESEALSIDGGFRLRLVFTQENSFSKDEDALRCEFEVGHAGFMETREIDSAEKDTTIQGFEVLLKFGETGGRAWISGSVLLKDNSYLVKMTGRGISRETMLSLFSSMTDLKKLEEALYVHEESEPKMKRVDKVDIAAEAYAGEEYEKAYVLLRALVQSAARDRAALVRAALPMKMGKWKQFWQNRYDININPLRLYIGQSYNDTDEGSSPNAGIRIKERFEKDAFSDLKKKLDGLGTLSPREKITKIKGRDALITLKESGRAVKGTLELLLCDGLVWVEVEGWPVTEDELINIMAQNIDFVALEKALLLK